MGYISGKSLRLQKFQEYEHRIYQSCNYYLSINNKAGETTPNITRFSL